MANSWEQYILEGGRRRGIDPGLLQRVINGEGGFRDPVRQSEVINKAGLREPSYGPFQMLVGGEGTGFPAGLGNDALAVGIDPRNPEHAQRAADFALDTIARDGWGRWNAAKKLGITGMEGIDGRGVTLNSTPVSSNRVGIAPTLPDPIEVKSHPVAGVQEETGIFDKIASGVDKIGPAIFGSQENADKLKGLFGAGADPKNPMAAGLGMVKDAVKRKDPERENFIPSSGALNPSADASRMVSAQQLMATILAARNKNRGRGLTLGGMA